MKRTLSIRLNKDKKLKLSVLSKLKYKSMSKIINDLLDIYLEDNKAYIGNLINNKKESIYDTNES